MINKIVFALLLLSATAYGQRYAFDYSNKEWTSSDFPAGITRVKAYEYKIKKNGKVKRDSTQLYSQRYHPLTHKVTGTNYVTIFTIGYNDKVTADRDYYEFETCYSPEGKFRIRKAHSGNGPAITDSTNTSVLAHGVFEPHKSGTETIVHKPSSYNTLEKEEKTYDENGLITRNCSTYTNGDEQCEYTDYIYKDGKLVQLVFTGCNGSKAITYFTYNSLGLIAEERDTLKGKTYKLVRYYYE